MNMSNHVNGTCKKIRLSLKTIGGIRKYLFQESVKKLVNALVISRIDYVNSLLCKAPKMELNELQRAMNSAARVVAGINKSDHPLTSTPATKKTT